jgi:hypothetical protein
MNQNLPKIYHITTKERTYNHVEGASIRDAKESFQTVRDNWEDTTKVTSIHRWDSEYGEWVPIQEFAPIEWLHTW